MSAATQAPLLLLGCGILRREVDLLIARNGWPVETSFLRSDLHTNLGKLSRGLMGSLAKRADRDVIVFYGCCHPLMDRMLEAVHTPRVEGQNCIEMLLGPERFFEELERGAFFLLEDWALHWKTVLGSFLEDDPEVTRAIFREGERRYVLAIRTPCSGDFAVEAEAMSASAGLPLVWTEVNLDHLERVLERAVAQRLRARHD